MSRLSAFVREAEGSACKKKRADPTWIRSHGRARRPLFSYYRGFFPNPQSAAPGSGSGSVVVSPPEEVGSSPEEVEEEDSGVLEDVGVLLMVAGSRPKDW